jgi:hypothetical protein
VKFFHLVFSGILLMAVVVACRSKTETNDSEPIATNPIIPLATETNKPITVTPAPLPTFTEQPNTCFADEKLPNADTPENYIGWKPGFDFAKQYNDENKDGNYLYWEYDKGNLRLAAYKKSDNSFLIFLEKFLCSDNQGTHVFEVVDAVRTRPLGAEEDIAPMNYVCYLLGEDGISVKAEVVAIVNTTNLKAVEVWNADGEKMDIQELATENTRCATEGITAPKP